MIGAISLAEPALAAFNDLKKKRKYRWVIFKFENDKDIVLDAVGEPSATFEDFVSKMPKSEPRYLYKSLFLAMLFMILM